MKSKQVRIEETLLDWNVLPDLAAICLLAVAFASIMRRSQTSVSRYWMAGWLMILLHFVVSLFENVPGSWGVAAQTIGIVSLVCAGIVFQSTAIPYRNEASSNWMMVALLGTNTLYVVLLMSQQGAGRPPASWALNAAAALIGLCPLAIAMATLKNFNHPLRWSIVVLSAALSFFLVAFQNRPGSGTELALDAVLFTVYFDCAVSFVYTFRRASAGAIITIIGFVAWASVFAIYPLLLFLLPQARVESEVWNLPKFIVAVGMILILLEDQIQHNLHLALHDSLTGLPNRRLFQDRLNIVLERARRNNTHAALLVIDLDRFKQVNDMLGHHVGDLLLQRVGGMLTGRVRRTDTVARTGGDEFSVILEEPTNREDARQVADSLVRLLREPLQLGERVVKVGASVGMAVFPEDASSAEALCIAADLKMYDVKYGKRGQIMPFPAPVGTLEATPSLQESMIEGN